MFPQPVSSLFIVVKVVGNDRSFVFVTAGSYITGSLFKFWVRSKSEIVEKIMPNMFLFVFAFGA
jgi:hypothetical protein